MTNQVVSSYQQTQDPKSRLHFWPKETLLAQANGKRLELLLDRNHIAKPLAWCPISPQHALSDWYYQLWFFYEIRLKLVNVHGHDYDEEPINVRKVV